MKIYNNTGNFIYNKNEINLRTPLLKRNGAVGYENFLTASFKGSIKQTNQDSFNISSDKPKSKTSSVFQAAKNIITSLNKGINYKEAFASAKFNEAEFAKFEKLIDKGIEVDIAMKVATLEDDKFSKYESLLEKDVDSCDAFYALDLNDVQYERFLNILGKGGGSFSLQAAKLNNEEYEKFETFFSKGLRSSTALKIAILDGQKYKEFQNLTQKGLTEKIASDLAPILKTEYSMPLNDKLKILEKLECIKMTYSSSFLETETFSLNSEIEKVQNSLKENTITTTDVSKERVIQMMKGFFANNNEELEKTLSTADFAKYGKDGIPLKYSRKEFLADLSNELSELPVKEKFEIIKKLGIDITRDTNGNITKYNGIIDLTKLSSEGTEGKVLELAKNFISNNEVVTGNDELDNALNSLIQGMPEFINVIGKKQHGTHNLSVDSHILTVLQNVMSDPDYKKLSDKEKFCLKFATVLHDIAKSEGVIDEKHAEVSALYAKDILNKPYMNLSSETRNRIFEMIKNHHWLKEYNTGVINADSVAARFRRTGDLSMARILAKADLKGVSESFYETYKSALNEKKQKPITMALEKINSTGQMFLANSIINKSKVPTVKYNGRTYKVVNLSTLSQDTDLSQYGFEPNTTVDNLRLLVHMIDKNILLYNTEKVATLEDASKEAVLCASFISMENKNTYWNNDFGVVLQAENANIANASLKNQTSGYDKNFKRFSNIISETDKISKYRNQISDLIRDCLGLKIIDDRLTSEVYSKLFSIIQKYNHASQLDNIPSITVGNKTFTGKQIKEAITIANDFIITKEHHNELNVYTPKVNAVIAKVNSIEEVPQYLLNFAERHNLPILLLGK